MAFISISGNSREENYETFKKDIVKRLEYAKKYSNSVTTSYRYENGTETINESTDVILYQSPIEENNPDLCPWFLDFKYTESGSLIQSVFSQTGDFKLEHDFIEPGKIQPSDFEDKIWGIELRITNTDCLENRSYKIFNRNSARQNVSVRNVNMERNLFVLPSLPLDFTRYDSSWIGKNITGTQGLIVFSEKDKLFPTAVPSDNESGLFVYIGGIVKTVVTKNIVSTVVVGALYKITLAEYETYKLV